MKRFLLPIVALTAWLLPLLATAQPALVIKPLAEKKTATLPAGDLFWRIENFPALAQARSGAGEWSLATESAGKVWLFTLGAAGGSSPGGVKVAEVGPIPRVAAAEYLLRINEASGPPGSLTPVHSHPAIGATSRPLRDRGCRPIG